jgi:hypothetical protein
MSNLTYDQHCARDRLVVSIVRDIVDSVEYNNGELNWIDKANFDGRIAHLSDEARRQVTEEVRQVLLLLEKLNKKRVM